MGYYDRNYRLDDDYGDEDQNEMMWLIDAWREDDEPREASPAKASCNPAPSEGCETSDGDPVVLGPESDEDDDYDPYEEYESEEDVARGEGFWVDEDGHWRPLGDDFWDD